jgi:osmotically-inducible protein OsmY
MSWLQRLFGEVHSRDVTGEDTAQNHERMSPGLTGEYDLELREKAGMHQPPPPPEYMGLEGEYDPSGLAKRVATALDQEPDVADIETLQVTQSGSTVIFEGAVPSVSALSRITGVASKVDGTKAVDTNQVAIKAD